MTLLPIAAPTAPSNGAGGVDTTTGNGDFAALLALVAGTVVSPPAAPVTPDEAVPEADALAPPADPVEPARDEPQPQDVVAVAAAPVQVAVPCDVRPRPASPRPLPGRPATGVQVPQVAVDSAPALVEAPPPASPVPLAPLAPAGGTPAPPASPGETTLPAPPVVEAPAPPARVESPPTGPGEVSAAAAIAVQATFERPPLLVEPPGRGRPPVSVPASRIVAGGSPAPVDVPADPTPPGPVAPGPLETAAAVSPPGAPARIERPSVRVPASPAGIEASPALVEAPLPGQESPVAPENFVPESRVPVKPLPRIDAPASVPLPAPVARAEATLPVDAPAPAPAAPPAVPEQIVSAVVPLHGRGDGRHEVTLELRPDDLGTIRVEVSVEQQTVHLTLHAAEPATGRLLSAALADLRSALADAGLQAGHLAVSPDGGGATARRPRPETPLPERRSATSTTPETVRRSRPAASGRLDLLL
jgi:flagellar hook-length control protein FliK